VQSAVRAIPCWKGATGEGGGVMRGPEDPAGAIRAAGGAGQMPGSGHSRGQLGPEGIRGWKVGWRRVDGRQSLRAMKAAAGLLAGGGREIRRWGSWD